jgi:hypothetical protein
VLGPVAGLQWLGQMESCDMVGSLQLSTHARLRLILSGLARCEDGSGRKFKAKAKIRVQGLCASGRWTTLFVHWTEGARTAQARSGASGSA